MRCHAILGLVLLMTTIRIPGDADLLIVTPPPDDPHGQSGSAHSPVAPRPNPDASGKYHAGDGVSPPELLLAPEPEFTDKARRKRLGGTVVLSLTVDIQGNPQDVRVMHSLSANVSKKLQAVALGLDESAVKAVKQYRFQPARFQGNQSRR